MEVHELTSDATRLSDLIYTYPSQDDPDFQTLITARREFSELASDVTEPVPAPGHLYKHQELIRRFLIAYDRLLLIHRAGTGKTCTAFGSAEALKGGIIAETVNFIEDYIRPQRTNIKRIYFLTRGPILVAELKKQLVCVCTNGTYLTPSVINATTEQQQKINVTRAIEPYYSIQTYSTFVNEIIRRNLSDQKLHELYDDTMFIIDEVQNIRSDYSTTTEEEGRRNYATLHYLFHLIQRSKVVLASATPMIDDVSEIADVMNLILPLDRQLRLSNYDTATLEQLEPYFRGLVSYVRELDTGIVPSYVGNIMDAQYKIGDRIVTAQAIVYPSTMTSIQLQGYHNSLEGGSNNFYTASRMASNFVFPDGGYDKESFQRYTIKVGADMYNLTPELDSYIPNRLHELSAKLATMLPIVIDEPGSTFIYCDFKDAGGASIIGAVLRSMGIEQFVSNSSPFTSVEGGLKPVCASSGQGRRTITIDKRLRFAMITSDTPPARSAAIQDLFNSYDNRHGEYLKILIGSPISKVGLNLANVTQVHLFGPAWNQSHIYQAISRAIRTTSHVALLSEAKAELIERGLNPDGAKIPVYIYRHASLTETELLSTDLHIYQMAEQKDISIRRMERILKQVAFDCQIHYKRNVRPTDIDYSAACDYDICDYPCVSAPPTREQIVEAMPSYNMLYSGTITDKIAEALKAKLLVSPLVTLSELYDSMNYSHTDILLALEELITNKTVVTDRFGFEGFVGLDGDNVFIQRDYPLVEGSKSSTYYVGNLIAIKRQNITEYSVGLEAPYQEGIISTLEAMDPDSAEFRNMVDNLNLPSKIVLLEAAYVGYVNKTAGAWADKVLEIFESFVYWFHEPVNSILRIEGVINSRVSGLRKSPKVGKVKRVNIHNIDLNIPSPDEESDTEIVYLHTLYSQSYDKTAYAVVAHFNNAAGRLRIYKPSEEVGFRDTTEYETPVYSEMIQLVIGQRLEYYEQHDIYGSVLADKKFRIRDKTTEATQAIKDARKINRGKICKTWRKPDLIDVMWQLGIEPPNIVDSGMDDMTAQAYLIKHMTESPRVRIADMDPDKIQFFTRWYMTGMAVANMCQLLQQELAARGLLFTV